MYFLKRAYVSAISKVIWASEKLFFYPKLAEAYLGLLKVNKAEKVIILDIGAHKGESVKFFSSLYPKPVIYAFEPSRISFAALKHAVDKIEDNEISIFQIGIGDQEKVADFFDSILSETSTFIRPNINSQYLRRKNRILLQFHRDFLNSTPTRLTTVDAFVSESKINRIDIMKIDTEGYELQALLGAEKALREGKVRIIQFERHMDDMREDSFVAINEFLSSLRFKKVYEIQHFFGNFFDIIYEKSRD
jgi:FkbM family methyltransferase